MDIDDKCVYFHINKVTGVIFYVGIGASNRPYATNRRNRFWHDIVNKYGYIIQIVHSGITWFEAAEWERYYIKRLGRKDLGLGYLVNLTDGGSKLHGFRHTQDSKDKFSGINSPVYGKPRPQEVRDKISSANKGKPKSKEHRDKISATLKGRKLPEWIRQKMRDGHKHGKLPPRTIEHSNKIAEVNRRLFKEGKRKWANQYGRQEN